MFGKSLIGSLAVHAAIVAVVAAGMIHAPSLETAPAGESATLTMRFRPPAADEPPSLSPPPMEYRPLEECDLPAEEEVSFESERDVREESADPLPPLPEAAFVDVRNDRPRSDLLFERLPITTKQIESAEEIPAAGIHTPAPEYPAMARRMGQEGSILIAFDIGAEGACGNIVIVESSGFDSLDLAAAEAVAEWRFEPARSNGTGVPSHREIRFHFRLTDPS